MLSRCISSALKDDNVQIILSDGGSTDLTKSIATNFCVKYITGGKSRSECQNIGAEIAQGDIVLFLHGDTILPPKYGAYIRNAFQGIIAIYFVVNMIVNR